VARAVALEPVRASTRPGPIEPLVVIATGAARVAPLVAPLLSAVQKVGAAAATTT
jgi:hypothetical protein